MRIDRGLYRRYLAYAVVAPGVHVAPPRQGEGVVAPGPRRQLRVGGVVATGVRKHERVCGGMDGSSGGKSEVAVAVSHTCGENKHAAAEDDTDGLRGGNWAWVTCFTGTDRGLDEDR